jgi:hypothetical protein
MRGHKLTENSSGSIITGETGLAHSRTTQPVSNMLEYVVVSKSWEWRVVVEAGEVFNDCSTPKTQACVIVGAYPLSITRAATSSINWEWY